MRMNPAARRGGPLLALALACAVASCTTHGAMANTGNPAIKAVIVTMSQWGQCLVAAGENLHHTLSTVKGETTADGILLTFDSGDQFLVRNPASSSPVATAGNGLARAHVAHGLAREPACHTTRALSEKKAAQLVQPRKLSTR